MSIFDDAQVVVLAADYIGMDASGKINAIGAGFTVSGVLPTGLVAPQHIAVLVDLPSRHAGAEFSLSIELRDESTDSAVKVAGPGGQLEPLRIGQLAKVLQFPSVPGVYIPARMFCRVQALLAFPNGLPVAPGGFYFWRVEIDGQHRKHWKASFHVLGPPPPAVFGGPTGPAGIPTLPAP